MAGTKQNLAPMWEKLTNDVDILEPTSFLDHVDLGCTQRECKPNEKIIGQYNKMFDYQIKKEELESKGELSEVCSHIVLKCLYLARIGRPDSLWSVNKLARSVTKWTQACDRQLARLISNIHFTSDYRQYLHVSNAAQHCRLGLFQGSDFAEDLEDSKSASGGVLCIFGRRTILPISWMCKKRTSVSNSSTESEIISLDAGLRMDGLLALDLWDLVIEVLRTTQRIPKPTQVCTRETGVLTQITPKIKQVLDQNVDLSNIDQVPSNAHLSEKKIKIVHLRRQ